MASDTWSHILSGGERGSGGEGILVRSVVYLIRVRYIAMQIYSFNLGNLCLLMEVGKVKENNRKQLTFLRVPKSRVEMRREELREYIVFQTSLGPVTL